MSFYPDLNFCSTVLPVPSKQTKSLYLDIHSLQSQPTASTSTSSTTSTSSRASSTNTKSSQSTTKSKPERKKRTTPCERCRRIRKRCDFSIPCVRCVNARSECVYISARSRADEDRERVVIYEEVFDDVEDVLLGVEEMEKEVKTLRGMYTSTNMTSTGEEAYGTPPPSDSNSDVHDDDIGAESCDEHSSLPEYNFQPSSFPSDVFSPVKTSFNENIETVNWQLSVGKNGIRVDTNIRTLEDLKLFLINSMTKTQINQTKHLLPELIPLPAGQIWRQFSWFFSTQLHIEDLSVPIRKLAITDATSYPSPLRRPAVLHPDNHSPEVVQHIVSHLLEVFFSCTNNKFHFIIKDPFLARFYNRRNPTQSPVICALSSWMVTHHCPHLFPAPKWNIPLDARRAWGKYFFELAQDQEEDMFDEPKFENFLCLLFMTQYLMGSRYFNRAESYIKHAVRVAEVLFVKYKDMPPTAPLEEQIERESFKRFALYAVGIQRAIVLVVGKGRFSCINNVCAIVGMPKPLPMEDESVVKTVALMNYLIGLEDVLTGIQMRSSMIPYTDYPRLQKLLLNWWTSIPSSLKPSAETEGPRLNSKPISWTPELIFAAEICINYHSTWMVMHSRLLPDPTDPFLHVYLDDPLRRAAYEEVAGLNGERSIEICRRSARIVTTLAEQLERNPPCHFDYHALPQARNIHWRLSQIEPYDKLNQEYYAVSVRLESKLFVDPKSSDNNGRPLNKRGKVSEGRQVFGGGWVVAGGDNWLEAI